MKSVAGNESASIALMTILAAQKDSQFPLMMLLNCRAVRRLAFSEMESISDWAYLIEHFFEAIKFRV